MAWSSFEICVENQPGRREDRGLTAKENLMYPEGVDRLPNTWQSQLDKQPLLLLPRKDIPVQEKRLCPGEKAVFGGYGSVFIPAS